MNWMPWKRRFFLSTAVLLVGGSVAVAACEPAQVTSPVDATVGERNGMKEWRDTHPPRTDAVGAYARRVAPTHHDAYRNESLAALWQFARELAEQSPGNLQVGKHAFDREAEGRPHTVARIELARELFRRANS